MRGGEGGGGRLSCKLAFDFESTRLQKRRAVGARARRECKRVSVCVLRVCYCVLLDVPTQQIHSCPNVRPSFFLLLLLLLLLLYPHLHLHRTYTLLLCQFARYQRLVCYVTGIDNIRDAIAYPRFPGSAEF